MMKFILKLLLVIILIIGCVIFAVQIFIPKATVSKTQLYAQADRFIQSKPSESEITVADIFANYQKLETRWVGQDNALKNHIYLKNNPNFAKTTIFESNNLIESNLTVEYLRVNYVSESHNVSGLVLIPHNQAIKGIVLYFHSTISAKLNVPSLNFTEYKAEMLAAIFAAHGYIVIAPDYIGLGNNYQDTHPYILYPQLNINDGKNMLNAVIPQLRKQHVINNEHFLPLFVSGYSEGASYALWFSRVYQENKLFKKEITQQQLYLAHTVAIEGAYDLSGVMLPFLLSNQYNEANNLFHINTTFWGIFS